MGMAEVELIFLSYTYAKAGLAKLDEDVPYGLNVGAHRRRGQGDIPLRHKLRTLDGVES